VKRDDIAGLSDEKVPQKVKKNAMMEKGQQKAIKKNMRERKA